MLTFFYNLWTIARQAPAIIAIIKQLMDIAGSEQVQKILEAIKDAFKKEVPTPDSVPVNELQQQRLIDRIRRRLDLALNMSDADYMNFCQYRQNVSNRENNLTA